MKKIEAPASMYDTKKTFGELVKETAHLNPVRVLLGETTLTDAAKYDDGQIMRHKRAKGGAIPGEYEEEISVEVPKRKMAVSRSPSGKFVSETTVKKINPMDSKTMPAPRIGNKDQKSRMNMMMGKGSK